MLSFDRPGIFLLFIFFSIRAVCQQNFSPPGSYVVVAASDDYQKSKIHQFLFGENRRKEWSAPVKVPVLLLDSVFGGLVPYQKAGGGESKSLRLKSLTGMEYVLRSIEKSRHGAVPKLLKNTCYASLIQDGVSMSHPYGAFAVPLMLEAVNIPHTTPQLVYLPWQEKLDTFNNSYAENLYLLEERPAGDWSNTAKLGRFKKYSSTSEVQEQLRESNRYKTDQHLFLKARLLDILISDVDRHEGNWKWGLDDTGSTIYKAVPIDRDQVFFTHNGVFSGIALALTRRRFMQNFDYKIHSVKKLTLTKQDRKLDEFFSNEMDYDDWIEAANQIQKSLTNNLITKSVKQLPPEIFAISGEEIIKKLLQRRDMLHKYAAQYYFIMAKKVEINGSNQREHFEVKNITNNRVAVSVYRIDSKGKKEESPYYYRIFNTNETKNITINPLGGDDVFKIDKGVRKIRVKVKPGN